MSMFLSLTNLTYDKEVALFLWFTFTHGELSWYQDVYNVDNKHAIAGFIFLT